MVVWSSRVSAGWHLHRWVLHSSFTFRNGLDTICAEISLFGRSCVSVLFPIWLCCEFIISLVGFVITLFVWWFFLLDINWYFGRYLFMSIKICINLCKKDWKSAKNVMFDDLCIVNAIDLRQQISLFTISLLIAYWIYNDSLNFSSIWFGILKSLYKNFQLFNYWKSVTNLFLGDESSRLKVPDWKRPLTLKKSL